MQEKAQRSNQARTEATLAALKAAARQLFVSQGYAATGTPDIVRAAGVTRGALYHHFVDKAALFFAVAEDMAREVAQAIEACEPAHDTGAGGTEAALLALQVGAEAYLRTMGEGGRAKLLLQDAPAVLSPAQLARLSDLAGADGLRLGLQALLASASSEPVNAAVLEALTQQLSAVFDRMALALVAQADMGAHRAALQMLLHGVALAYARGDRRA